MKIFIAILVYNEYRPLTRLLRELQYIRGTLGALGVDCYFIDDSSSDCSRDLILRAGWPCLIHRYQTGIAGCIETAYLHAVDNQFTHLLLFPGNGRVNPSELIQFIKASVTNPNFYIVGNRFLVKGQLTKRGRLAILLNHLLRKLTNGKINDITSLTRVIPLELLQGKKLIPGYRGEHQVHQFALMGGYNILELPIKILNHEDRPYSHFGFKGQFGVLRQWVEYSLQR